MTERERKVKEDNWKYRRALVYGTVGSMLAMLGYLTVYGSGDNAVQSMIGQMLPFGIAGIVLPYIGFPVADDWLQMRVNKS